MRMLNVFQPSIVIHSAAERRPDVVEKQPEATRQINIDATRYLCEAAGMCTMWCSIINLNTYRNIQTMQGLRQY